MQAARHGPGGPAPDFAAKTDDKLDRVVASTDGTNVASVGVMERAGMRFDRREVIDGLDTIFYVCERGSFAPAPGRFEVREGEG